MVPGYKGQETKLPDCDKVAGDRSCGRHGETAVLMAAPTNSFRTLVGSLFCCYSTAAVCPLTEQNSKNGRKYNGNVDYCCC